jgi:hypothetical protein
LFALINEADDRHLTLSFALYILLYHLSPFRREHGLPVVSMQTSKLSKWFAFDPTAQQKDNLNAASMEFLDEFGPHLMNLNTATIPTMTAPISGYFSLIDVKKLGAFETVSTRHLLQIPHKKHRIIPTIKNLCSFRLSVSVLAV